MWLWLRGAAIPRFPRGERSRPLRRSVVSAGVSAK